MSTSSYSLTQQAYVMQDLLKGVYRPWGYEQWQVAEGLHQLEIAPGDPVAFIGDGFDNSWARLARVRIGAEMRPPEEKDFWAADAGIRQQLMSVFAETGARALVTAQMPNAAPIPGWRRVGTTAYDAYLLP